MFYFYSQHSKKKEKDNKRIRSMLNHGCNPEAYRNGLTLLLISQWEQQNYVKLISEIVCC